MSIDARLNKLLKQAGNVPLTENYLKRVSNAYATAITEINNSLAAMYNKFGDKVPIEKLYEKQRLTALRREIQTILGKAQRTVRNVTRGAIETNLIDGYAWDGYAYTEVFTGGAGVKMNFAKFDPNLTIASVKNPKDKITDYIFKQQGANGKWHWENSLKDSHAKAFRVVNDRITQGLIQGKGYSKTSRDIRRSLFGKKKHQFNMVKSVERIVRTESQKARNLAHLIGYEDLKKQSKGEFETRRLWEATFDDRVRDSHIALQDVPEDKEGMWTIEGTKTPAPTMSGVAGIDINCRCRAIVETKGLESSYVESNVSTKLTKSGFDAYKNNGYSKVA